MTNFIIYIDDQPTRAIFQTLEEAKNGAKDDIAGNRQLRIETVNSPNPVEKWLYDHSIGDWVEQR